MNKNRSILTIILCASLMFILAIFSWIKPQTIYSDSERRALEKFPELSLETVISGKFTSQFESYTQDQFPLRDSFRTIKALSSNLLFHRLDNNDVYLKEGYLSKIEYPLNMPMLDYATNKFNQIHDTYFKDTNVKTYLSIVPDKSYFLAEDEYLSLDYNLLVDTIKKGTEKFEYIDIFPLLELNDYYYTDTHWKQERIIDVAELLLDKMGNPTKSDYETLMLDVPFYGVYHGQAALPLNPDNLQYLTNDILESSIVTSFGTGKAKEIPLYDLNKAQGKDAYEMFLNGSDPLITIENPNSSTNKELVVFRDSFGSSLVPLLVENYAKVTIVDIRYMQSSLLGNFIEFNNQDVLFIYSTLVLNNSLSLN